MTHYTAPRVVSVRIPGEVFEALKTHAKDQGRSVSGSITYLVKEEVATRLLPRRASRKLTGFLSHIEVPESFHVWQSARREVGKKFVPAGRKSARRGATR
jgi:hypothetical protein